MKTAVEREPITQKAVKDFQNEYRKTGNEFAPFNFTLFSTGLWLKIPRSLLITYQIELANTYIEYIEIASLVCVCVGGGGFMDSSWIHTLSANCQIILIMFPASNNEDTFLALSTSIALLEVFLHIT